MSEDFTVDHGLKDPSLRAISFSTSHLIVVIAVTLQFFRTIFPDSHLIVVLHGGNLTGQPELGQPIWALSGLGEVTPAGPLEFARLGPSCDQPQVAWPQSRIKSVAQIGRHIDSHPLAT